MEYPRQLVVAVQETKSICFRRALYPWGGEYARGWKWWPQARNSAGRGREKSILPQGIQHKGYLRFPKPVSFHRDFWGEEQCCKYKCVKILMEETVRRTHCDQISKEKLIAHLLRLTRRSTTRQLMAVELPTFYTKSCGLLWLRQHRRRHHHASPVDLKAAWPTSVARERKKLGAGRTHGSERY